MPYIFVALLVLAFGCLCLATQLIDEKHEKQKKEKNEDGVKNE